MAAVTPTIVVAQVATNQPQAPGSTSDSDLGGPRTPPRSPSIKPLVCPGAPQRRQLKVRRASERDPLDQTALRIAARQLALELAIQGDEPVAKRQCIGPR